MYVQVVKTPLFGPKGDVVGLQGIFWDITEQRLAEEKIRRVNSLLAQNRKELRARNRQMQEDLKMAKEVQLMMLPQQYPSFPSSAPAGTSALQFTHRYLPTGAVGGDFFSISTLSETEAGVFICDVAGHGVRSALVTGMVRALVEELKSCALDPGQFLTKLNQDLFVILQHSGSPLLTTAFYLVADATTGQIRFANAGHPKPLRVERESGKVTSLANDSRKSQPALGLLDKCLYQTSSATLGHGDMVMLFTDGLYEVHNAADELYTRELLVRAVEKLASVSGRGLFDALLDDIRRFSGSESFADDVCLVGLQYR
jgi:sigma-B regulation protein RsbU (phosphoserine phosphatase)